MHRTAEKSVVLSSLLILAVPILAFSQALKPGYLIQHQGDTLKGLVEEQTTSSYECRFTKASDIGVTSYNAKNISGYGFDNGLHFRSAKLNETSKFYEVILTGKASLLAIENNYGVLKDSTLIYLEPKAKVTYINDITYTLEDRTAISKLATLLSDCQRGLAFDKVTLYGTSSSAQQKKLTQLLDDYNACVGSPSIKTKAQPQMSKGRLNFSLMAGIAKPGIRTSGKVDFIFGADYKTDPAVSIGALLHFTYPRVSNRTELLLGLQYYRESFSGDYTVTSTYTVSSKYSEIRALTGFRYSFSRKNLVPYLRAGIGLSYFLNATLDVTERDLSNNVFYSESIKLQSGGLSFHGSLGLAKKIKNGNSAFVECAVDTGANIILKSLATAMYVYYPGINVGYTF
jgi:Lipid A 3-O-deacylase (PagL)